LISAGNKLVNGIRAAMDANDTEAGRDKNGNTIGGIQFKTIPKSLGGGERLGQGCALDNEPKFPPKPS
jgi:hypothetical protein